jgi:predicted nucleic acid-binding protein
MRVLVDSSVWVNHLRGVATPTVLHLRSLAADFRHELLVADLIVLEVSRGCTTQREFDSTVAMFNGLECVDLGGKAACLQAARVYRALRAEGVTVAKTVDLLIASWCIANQTALLHDDKDFAAFESLGLVVATA